MKFDKMYKYELGDCCYLRSPGESQMFNGSMTIDNECIYIFLIFMCTVKVIQFRYELVIV